MFLERLFLFGVNELARCVAVGLTIEMVDV